MSATTKWLLGLVSSVVITVFGAIMTLGIVTQKEMYDDLKFVKNEINNNRTLQGERYLKLDGDIDQIHQRLNFFDGSMAGLDSKISAVSATVTDVLIARLESVPRVSP